MLLHAAGPNDDPENTRGEFVSLSPWVKNNTSLQDANCLQKKLGAFSVEAYFLAQFGAHSSHSKETKEKHHLNRDNELIVTSLWRLNAFRRTWIPNQLGKELPYISSICLLSKWPNGRVSHFSSSPDQFSKRHMSHEKNPFTFHYTGCLIGILMILIMTHHNPHITG